MAQILRNANISKQNSVHSQPRWSGTHQGFILTDVLGESREILNQAKHSKGGLGTKTSESLNAEGNGDKICSTKEIPLTIVSHPGNQYAVSYNRSVICE